MLDVPAVRDSASHGPITIVQADVTEWLPQAISDESFDLILADFPFTQDRDYGEFVADCAREFWRVLSPGGNLFVLNNPANTLRGFSTFEAAGFTFRCPLVCARPGRFTPAWQLPFAHNYGLFFCKGDKQAKWNGPRVNHDRNYEGMTDVVGFQNGVRRGRLWHPEAVPVELWREVLELLSDRGDSVLDAFGGSGSSITAAFEMGRSMVSVDVSRNGFVMCCTAAEAGDQVSFL